MHGTKAEVPLILLCLLSTAGRCSGEELLLKPAWVCGGDDELRIKGKFGKEFHWLCLREQSIATSSLLAKTAFLIEDPFSNDKQVLQASNITLVRGYTIGEGEVGTAEGYLGVDGDFVGALHYHNRTIHADGFDSEDVREIYGHFRDDHEPPPPLPGRGGRRRRRRRDLAGDTSPSAQVVQSTRMTSSSQRPKAKTGEEEYPADSDLFDNVTLSRWAASSAAAGVKPHARRSPVAASTEKSTSSKPLPIYVFRKKPRKNQRRKPPIAKYVVKPSPAAWGGARARLCELLLLADHEFYTLDANRSLEHAVRRMLHAVAQADLIFRNADFDDDGVPDNIGFSVRYAVVLTSPETDRRVLGELPPRAEHDGRDYLMRFARMRRLGDVCLGVAFTGRAFRNRTLGLSFTSLGGGKGEAAGGVCDRRVSGRSFNTLVVSHAGAGGGGGGGGGGRLPERVATLALAHELGHSFGARHDEMFPRQGCDGFLMSKESTGGEDVKHFQFSPCSRRLIRLNLDGMGYCLVYDDRTYCGNGVVEPGEACDCGLPSECAARDRCCTPRAGAAAGIAGDRSVHVEGCSVSPSALCHPSQGGCCDLNCKFLDLSEEGIECSRMQDKCPCENRSVRCQCGLGGECLPDGTCAAAECARLGLHECTCPSHGPGGAVAAARRCGVCCLLPGDGVEIEERCASAETAARQQIATGRVLLEDLRDDDYSGPSVFFQMCPLRTASDSCAYVSLRAWYRRGACAALGELGTCAPSGVCEPRGTLPRPHVYPLLAAKPPPVGTVRVDLEFQHINHIVIGDIYRKRNRKRK